MGFHLHSWGQSDGTVPGPRGSRFIAELPFLGATRNSPGLPKGPGQATATRHSGDWAHLCFYGSLLSVRDGQWELNNGLQGLSVCRAGLQRPGLQTALSQFSLQASFAALRDLGR